MTAPAGGSAAARSGSRPGAPAGLLSALPRETSTLGPPWLATLRRRAAARLAETGLPNRKVEDWRFTPVSAIASVPFAPAAAGGEDGARAAAAALFGPEDADGAVRILVVNGRPLAAGPLPAGWEATPLSRALADEPARLEPHLGKLADAEYFAALNTAHFEDGLVLRARGQAEAALHVCHVALPGAGPVAAYPRLLCVLEPGAEATLIESYVGVEGDKHLTGAVTEVALAEDAALEHVRVQVGADSSYHAGALAVDQARGSRYLSRVVTLGGALARLDLKVRLGEGGACVLDGIYHAAGRDLVDHHTFLDHAEPRAESRESYRGIIDGSGQAVFDGTIWVRPDAQQTRAHQENRNLLLSDAAGVNTKPHLEIEADDVSCSHGATIGALDEDQLHYLRARGVPLGQAEAILTYAFVRELLAGIGSAPLRRRLSGLVRGRLPHGDRIRELDDDGVEA